MQTEGCLGHTNSGELSSCDEEFDTRTYEWGSKSDGSDDCIIKHEPRLQFPNPYYDQDGPEIRHVKTVIFPGITSVRSYRNAIELAVIDGSVYQALYRTSLFDKYLIELIRRFPALDGISEGHIPVMGTSGRCVMLMFVAELLTPKERKRKGRREKGNQESRTEDVSNGLQLCITSPTDQCVFLGRMRRSSCKRVPILMERLVMSPSCLFFRHVVTSDKDLRDPARCSD